MCDFIIKVLLLWVVMLFVLMFLYVDDMEIFFVCVNVDDFQNCNIVNVMILLDMFGSMWNCECLDGVNWCNDEENW